MEIKGIEAENFENYKVPALFVAFPHCSFKCDKEAGCAVCQNSALASSPSSDIPMQTIVDLYIDNPITKAIVFGGLEPFDSWEDLHGLISLLRYRTPDPIIIYTGYTEEEIDNMEYMYDGIYHSFLDILNVYENIIVKFGRFIPKQEKHYDKLLGVNLASPNQYAKVVSDDWWGEDDEV